MSEVTYPKNSDQLAKYILPEVNEIIYPFHSYAFAWNYYRHIVSAIATSNKTHTMMEIGGGRYPLFSPDESKRITNIYIVNDISQKELDKSPHKFQKQCFDISGDLPSKMIDSVDFAFSYMVFEHLKNSNNAYKNIYDLLRPGGMCLNFHPTLYSPPFIINKLFPESITKKALKYFHQDRNDEEIPKFPAYYSLCKATENNRRILLNIGFKDVVIIPFYGHEYFKKIPVVREMDALLSKFAMQHDWKAFSSYAYTIVVK